MRAPIHNRSPENRKTSIHTLTCIQQEQDEKPLTDTKLKVSIGDGSFTSQ